MFQRVLREAVDFYKKLCSPSLNLEQFKEILGREFVKEFGKEIKIREDAVSLGFFLDDQGTAFAALCYNFDGKAWLVGFDKTVYKVSFLWVDNNRQGMIFLSRLQQEQTLLFGEKGKILIQKCSKGKEFIAVA